MWNRIYNSIRLAIPVFLLCIALFSFNVNSTNASNFFTNKISTVEGVNNFVASIYDTILNLFVKKTKEVYVPVPVYISDTITTPVSEVVVDDTTKIYNNNLLSSVTQKESVNNNILYIPGAEDSESNNGKEYVEMEFFQNQVETIYNSIYNSTIANIDSHTETEIHGGGSSGISFATVDLGGTGISTVPNYGELLMGDGLGGYSLVATSSLGLLGGGGSSQWTTSGSDIYYTTGNVGIGTTTPQYGLHIFKSVGSASQNIQTADAAGEAAINLENTVRRWKIKATTASGDAFVIRDQTAGQDRFVIGNTGNIGIGSTSPYAKLSVAGTSIASTTLALRPISGQTANILDVYNTSGVLNTVITAAGSLGVGIANPTEVLHVGGNILSTTGKFMGAQSDYIDIGVTDNTTRFYTSSTGTFTSQIGPTTYFNTGNVGIGTTTPGANLDVNGTTRLGGLNVGVYPALTLNNKSTDAAGVGTGLQFKNRNDASNYMGGIQTIYRGGITSALTMMDFFAGGDSATPKMTLGGSGNLGIGTTSPFTTLSVVGDAWFENGSTKITVKNSANSVKTEYASNSIQSYNSNLFINAAGNNVLFSASSNIGIGTTTPASMLHLDSGTASLPSISLSASGGSLQTIGRASASFTGAGTTDLGIRYSNKLWLGNTGTASAVLDSSGNLGIGTTTPSSLLHLSGNGGVPQLIISGTAAGTNMKDWRFVADSTSLFLGTLNESTTATGDYAIRLGRETNSNDVDFIEFATNNEANKMRLTNSGNLGIGTTSPNAKLSVYGGSAGVAPPLTTGIVIEHSNDTGLSILTPDSSQSFVTFGNTSDNNAVQLVWDPVTDLFDIGLANAGADLRFMTGDNTEAVRILDTGNVGIGTTTPGNLLSLYKSTGSLISSIQSNGTAWAGIKISDLTDPMTYWNSGSNFRWGVTTANDGVTGFSEYMRISSTGNLGIGTTSPYKKLAIADASPAIVLSSTNTNISMGATYGDIDFTSDDLSGSGLMARIRAKANDNNFGGDADITFWTRAGGAEMSEKMRLTSFGGLSVGSTTGAAMLTVENITTRNSFVVSDQALDPTPFVIDNSGNVGVGTTTTDVANISEKLVVTGDIFIDNIAFNSGMALGMLGGVPYIQGANAANTGVKSLLLQPSGGSVGIATTSPVALLSLGNGSGPAGTTPALGINFGDPTANLYRLASGMIRTDGALAVGGNLNMYYGNQLLINKAGNNWLNFATRDTTGPEAVYNLSSIGTITTSNTSAISTIAGPLIARSLLYPNGEVLSATSSWAIGYTGSSTLFYPNNMPLATADGTLYYGDSNILATKGDGLFLSAKIYYPNNNVLVDGTSLYYPAGSTPITDATGNLYYSNGNTFVDSLGSIYDMNSNTLLFDATNLFLRERLVSSDGTGGITITNSPGYVGISSTTPWRNLSVDGTVAMNGLTSSATGNALCITSAKELTDSGGASCTPSSIRFKENVTTLNPGYAMDTLSKLKVVHFDYKEKQPYETNHSYGLIAEEVANIDNNLVDYGYDGLPVSLHFEKITGLLVQAVQEQKAQIEEIKSQAFLDKIIKGVTDSFASVVVRMQTAFVGELHVQEKLCVDDVCINKDQLKIILMNSGGTRYIPDTNPQPIIINNNNTNTDATSSTTEETTPPQASTTPQVQTPIEQPNTEPTNTPEQTPTVPPVEPVVEVTTPNPEPVEPTPVESAPEPEPAPISSPEPAPTEGQ